MIRRDFINTSVLGLGTIFFPGRLWSSSGGGNLDFSAPIEAIEFFRYDINIPRHFSWGTWHNRQHVFMKISGAGKHGWSEIPVSKNNPDFNLQKWASQLAEYKNLSLKQAFQKLNGYQVTNSSYSKKMMEFVEFGLLDLLGRVNKTPSLEILKLQPGNPVPGLYCILDKDLKKVAENAVSSLEQNLSSHMKVKMYGDEALDMKILYTVKNIIGNDAMIMSDANRGYKDWQELTDLKKLLIRFHENGLSAIEDPASMNINQWIELQGMLGDFSLIPDHNMGPSWESIHLIKKGMGRIYNLHPSRMGSITHSIELAKKIRSFGAKVMIGDDSLVGPACTMWQQLAIGAGAAWVEAIEKHEDSADFLNCVVEKATKKDDAGYFTMNAKPGFGLVMDEDKLKALSHSYVKL